MGGGKISEYVCGESTGYTVEQIPFCCSITIFLFAKRDTEIFEISVANETSTIYLES